MSHCHEPQRCHPHRSCPHLDVERVLGPLVGMWGGGDAETLPGSSAALSRQQRWRRRECGFGARKLGHRETEPFPHSPGASKTTRIRARDFVTSINEKCSPRPAQGLVRQYVPEGLVMHQALVPRHTPGLAASSHEPRPVVTEPGVLITLCHMLVRGFEQVPSPSSASVAPSVMWGWQQDLPPGGF